MGLAIRCYDQFACSGEGAKAEAISRAGQTTYYKYMVTGDRIEKGVLFSEIMRKTGSMLGFFGAAAAKVRHFPAQFPPF